jgi:hypothetical protein
VGGRPAGQRWRRLLTRGWLAAHVLALLFVAACLGLGWWQIGRAAAGNLLSYGYAIQWPAFAVFAVWVWIVEARKALREPEAASPVSDASGADATGADATSSDATGSDAPAANASDARSQPAWSRRRPRNEAAYDDSDDPALAAYNHYLAWLNANPHASPADYPGPPAR